MSHARTIIAAVFAATSTAAVAQGAAGVRVGNWNFDCRDGKLVGVHVILRIPGEVLLPVPQDICSPAWFERNAQGLTPAATIKPLPPIPQAEPAPATVTPPKKPI